MNKRKQAEDGPGALGLVESMEATWKPEPLTIGAIVSCPIQNHFAVRSEYKLRRDKKCHSPGQSECAPDRSACEVRSICIQLVLKASPPRFLCQYLL